MDKVINEILNNEYWINYYNTMNKKNNKELLEVLGNTLKNVNKCYDNNINDINNFENLGHYEKHKLINNDLGNYYQLVILNYILKDKNNI